MEMKLSSTSTPESTQRKRREERREGGMKEAYGGG